MVFWIFLKMPNLKKYSGHWWNFKFTSCRSTRYMTLLMSQLNARFKCIQSQIDGWTDCGKAVVRIALAINAIPKQYRLLGLSLLFFCDFLRKAKFFENQIFFLNKFFFQIFKNNFFFCSFYLGSLSFLLFQFNIEGIKNHMDPKIYLNTQKNYF